MSTQEICNQMRDKLAQSGIPHHSIDVFGAIRCNVHVVCLGRDTADKWARLLLSLFPSGRLTINKTSWQAAANRGTSMLPTMRKGWLVCLIS